MSNLDKLIDQAFSDLRSTCGGVRNDYFGLIYLETEHGVGREKACNQIAFGGNDYGIDGFHFDRERKNLYVFQFKYSEKHTPFKDSFHRLIDKGFELLFVSPNSDNNKNQIITQLRSCMIENRSLIKQVCFHFVFLGDPTEAERSQVLDKLREDLENKKYLIDRFFGEDQTTLVVDFRSISGKVGMTVDQKKTHAYNVTIQKMFSHEGANGEVMHLGLVKLVDLHRIYKDMGYRFFERNIRYGLGPENAVNRAISRSLKSILLEGKEPPEVFAFNHNGISLFAETIEYNDGTCHIVAPRLLNGAQTVTTFAGFMESNNDNPKLAQNKELAESLFVLCRVITGAPQSFVTTITINNNRQNPVEPWNLHANDMIQLQLQDKFKEDLGMHYERQQNSFKTMDIESEGITESKAVELAKLAQTFLVTDGNIQRLSNMRIIFEEEHIYNQVFNDKRLKADSRAIVLCYKTQFRLKRLIKDIMDRGVNKYAYAPKARPLLWALLCQGIMNDDNHESYMEEYGNSLSIPADFTEYLTGLATKNCRFLLAEIVNDEKYSDKVSEGNYSFLRTNQAYDYCMDVAYKKWKWVQKKLNK